jgi:hypothetical protein
MMNVIRPSLSALEIAGSLCGVPYVGAAAILLQDIARSCEDVAIHKVNWKFFVITDLWLGLIGHYPAQS